MREQHLNRPMQVWSRDKLSHSDWSRGLDDGWLIELELNWIESDCSHRTKTVLTRFLVTEAEFQGVRYTISFASLLCTCTCLFRSLTPSISGTNNTFSNWMFSENKKIFIMSFLFAEIEFWDVWYTVLKAFSRPWRHCHSRSQNHNF